MWRVNSLLVTKTTYSGLQENHEVHCYRAKSKAKGTYEHGNHRYRKIMQTLEACRRKAEEHQLKTVEHG
jgi:hypothetical protein